MPKSHVPSLRKLLKADDFPRRKAPGDDDPELRRLQEKMLRIQQGIWHGRQRAIIAIEGFDASGKGGLIHRLTELLDPRGFAVHPIGPPEPEEQARHWLYRFWARLPKVGQIAIFDRTWYGRVLVERVENLTPPAAWKRAYSEIHEFERVLTDDGIDLVKIFLGVSKAEQMRRFEARLKDPYKQWKISTADTEARAQWKQYVTAADDALAKTSRKHQPWSLVAADDKDYARYEALRIVTHALAHHGKWMEKVAARHQQGELKQVAAALKSLGGGG